MTLPGNTGITCIGRTYYRNLPANIKGAELEATITPIRGMVFNAAVGYSKFWSDDIAARTVNRRQGNPFWTASAGLQYRIEADTFGGLDHAAPRLELSEQPGGQRHLDRAQLSAA